MAQKPKAESAGFELQINKTEESFAWTTEKVEQLMLAIEEGYKPKSVPFYEGNSNLKKGNVVFDYTAHELKEIKRCATDIVYFANTYCTVMTDHGLKTIKLRSYQEEMLRQFQKERFNICLYEQFINEKRDITDLKKGDILIHDKTSDKVTVEEIISSTKIQVKNTKGEFKIISPYYYSIKESFLIEGIMKELHIMAKKSKSEDEFVKEFFQNFGDKIKQNEDSISWVKSLYKENKK